MERVPASAVAAELEDEYEVLGELGRGSISVVYLARDRVLGREVAIKVIREGMQDQPENLARLEREARVLAGLRHPNIVEIFGARRLSGGNLALVMRRTPGRTLKELVRRAGPLDPARAESILCDIARGLDHLHAHGIIHRDVKPENIFVDEQKGTAVLSDFGIAKSEQTATDVTLSGVVIGTPAYMSPEQIDGEALDGRSDLYSLGLVGYEMLVGKRPWDGENLYSVIYKQKHAPLPSLAAVRPDAPARLVRAIERAISKRKEMRWADAATLLGHLRPAAPPSSSVPVDVEGGEALDAAVPAEESLTIQYRRPTEEDGAPIVAADPVEDGAATSPAEARRGTRRRHRDAHRTEPVGPPGSALAPIRRPESVGGGVLELRRDEAAATAAGEAESHAPTARGRRSWRWAVAAAAAVVLVGLGSPALLPRIERADMLTGADAPRWASLDWLPVRELDGSARATGPAKGGSMPPVETDRAVKAKAAAQRAPSARARTAPAGGAGDSETGPTAAPRRPSASTTARSARGAASARGGSGVGRRARAVPPKPEEVADPVVPDLSASAPLVPTALDGLTGAGSDAPLRPPPLRGRAIPTAGTMPELLNRNEVLQALADNYPRLPSSVDGGTVVLSLYVDATGSVAGSTVKVSSGNADMDDAALRTVGLMRFRPAHSPTGPVAEWVDFPVIFSSREQ